MKYLNTLLAWIKLSISPGLFLWVHFFHPPSGDFSWLTHPLLTRSSAWKLLVCRQETALKVKALWSCQPVSRREEHHVDYGHMWLKDQNNFSMPLWTPGLSSPWTYFSMSWYLHSPSCRRVEVSMDQVYLAWSSMDWVLHELNHGLISIWIQFSIAQIHMDWVLHWLRSLYTQILLWMTY